MPGLLTRFPCGRVSAFGFQIVKSFFAPLLGEKILYLTQFLVKSWESKKKVSRTIDFTIIVRLTFFFLPFTKSKPLPLVVVSNLQTKGKKSKQNKIYLPRGVNN